MSCKIKPVRPKVNLDLWNLSLIRLNISSENNDKGYHCFQKNQLFKNVPI